MRVFYYSIQSFNLLKVSLYSMFISLYIKLLLDKILHHVGKKTGDSKRMLSNILLQRPFIHTNVSKNHEVYLFFCQ